ncbi:MotA/TolQ/ExbB proton channel family protein [Clostridium sp. MSJ-11]|uniref:MotA/TolQ/ExbB proton channel family protein n=1 Tax=Clostridium mobile TaxID=2841512 RepID=A0ABS6EDB5_9CLOT|nr:MotA/TolQ/ExbB proton channel family protein [Clostridium mobile]MBU5483028.1 MotA/TolQ/ExbB proton channel family protein [Clostridium mobile]
MKKRDALTGIGIVVGCFTMLWAMSMKSLTEYDFGQLKSFFDVASILITIGGSFCAMLITYPLSYFRKLKTVLVQTFKESEKSSLDIIGQFTELSRKARREGLLSLEDEINQINDGFLKKGLQMVVDGIEPDTIKDILELEISEMERRHKIGADMLRSWGGYAPAFGMAGTLIGLIQMLVSLTDSAQIASGMAKALVTTFYGSLMAYLFFNPMAANLALKSDEEAAIREMMLEGILSIQSGVNPRIVEEKLISYLSPEERTNYAVTVSKEGVAENG